MCQGDSGGPLFGRSAIKDHEDKAVLLAVSSMGTGPCTSENPKKMSLPRPLPF